MARLPKTAVQRAISHATTGIINPEAVVLRINVLVRRPNVQIPAQPARNKLAAIMSGALRKPVRTAIHVTAQEQIVAAA